MFFVIFCAFLSQQLAFFSNKLWFSPGANLVDGIQGATSVSPCEYIWQKPCLAVLDF